MRLPDLHRCVQHPARVGILVALQACGWATFTVLREEVGLTDGNLNRHLKVLVEEGWVSSRRSGLGRGSTTRLEITGAGIRGLETFRVWCLEVAGRIGDDGGSAAPEAEPDPDAGIPARRFVVDDRSRTWTD
ncbi:MAG: transcriptional regulator [Opitutaceae bacterium]